LAIGIRLAISLPKAIRFFFLSMEPLIVKRTCRVFKWHFFSQILKEIIYERKGGSENTFDSFYWFDFGIFPL
jgi:hypothetical protein